MNTTSTLSIATLVLAGLFSTGCSQQQVDGDNSGGSQVAGSSQQVAGSSQQVAGSSQTSQQQQAAPAEETTAPEPAAEPKADPNTHTHPAVPNCTNSITHTHPNGARSHTHHYGCKGGKRPTGHNKWTHTHPAIPGCTNSITHTHKYKNRNHTHHYGCKGARPGNKSVNVHALQRKLKAKGYYKGPINGVVTPETRAALQRYMQNR